MLDAEFKGYDLSEDEKVHITKQIMFFFQDDFENISLPNMLKREPFLGLHIFGSMQIGDRIKESYSSAFVRFLINKMQLLQALDPKEKSAIKQLFYMVSAAQAPTTIKWLVKEYGRKYLTMRDPDGATPIFFSAASGVLPTLKQLIRLGADIKAVKNNGDNILHAIVEDHKPKANRDLSNIIEWIREKYPDLFAQKNNEGLTPRSPTVALTKR